jgi:hypothetical protein
MIKIIILFLFIPSLTQAQSLQVYIYNELNRHTSTKTYINSAVQIDSFEYDQVGAILRHLRWTEAPDLLITSVEYNGTSYGPNTLSLYPNAIGNLDIEHENIGNRDASTFGLEVHWSPDDIWGNGNDQLVKDIAVVGLTAGTSRIELDPNFSLGTNIPTGNGYLLFYTDNELNVLELNETNNIFVVPLYICTPYTLTTTGIDDYCNNGQGSATTLPNGGTSPYTYLWDQGSTAANASGLQGTIGGRNYSVTATDANGCTVSDQVSISSNQVLTLQTVNTTTAHCGAATGQISVIYQGGAGNVSYSWSTGQVTNTGTLGGLTVGNYTVTATDVNGCTATVNNNIIGSGAIVINPSATDATCSNNNGAISLNLTGGLGNYSVLWSTGNTTPNISNLAAGSYIVTVNDGTCSETATIVVNDQVAPALAVRPYPTDCVPTGGQIGTTVSGGTAPFTYLWNTGSANDSLTALVAGNYILTVTDANNCTVTNTATINTINSLMVNTSILDDTCHLGVGSIHTIITGGSGSYSYAWSNGGTSNLVSGLVEGIYTVTITDSSAPTVCQVIHTDTLVSTQSIALAIQSFSADTCAYGNAALVMTAVGGTAPLIFTWDSGQSSLSIDSLSVGTYSLTATDANGCTATRTITIPAVSFLPNVTGYVPVVAAAICTLEVSENGNGLFLPYTYAWSNNTITNPTKGIPNQSYSVTVTNAIGCDTVLQFICGPTAIPVIDSMFDVTVFPNPNSGSQFSVEINGGEIQSYAIYDAIGQRLIWEEVQVSSGSSLLLPKSINVAATYVFVFDVFSNGQLYKVSKRVIKSKK